MFLRHFGGPTCCRGYILGGGGLIRYVRESAMKKFTKVVSLLDKTTRVILTLTTVSK